MTTQNSYHSYRPIYWEKAYPGCMDDFIDIFDNAMPEPMTVANWKETWIRNTSNTLNLNDVIRFGPERRHPSIAGNVCKKCNIHPYFYEFIRENGITQIVFYKEEHLVMFKLAYQNEEA